MTDSFEIWLKQVDKILSKQVGFTHDDLPDAMWADYHEDGLSPIEAIDAAVDDAWYDVEGLEELWRTNA
jgi:hypothetical protein